MVSVIVVSFNTKETTLRCLRCLMAESIDSETEILVVDNASTDGSADAIERDFPNAHLIRSSENLGFARANNLAVGRAAGGRFLLLNSDAFIKPGAVAALERYLDAHPRVAAVGPRLLNSDGSLQPSCNKFPGPARSLFDFLLLTAAMPNHPVLGDYRSWPHDEDRLVDFVTGACMMIRRSAFEQVGLFDESFFFYFEEADWCKRVTDAGWSIGFTPKGEVVHEGGGSGKAEPDRVFAEFQRGHGRFILKHYGRTGLAISRLALAVGAMIRLAAFAGRRVFGQGDPVVSRKWRRILIWALGFRGPGLNASDRPVVPSAESQHR